MIGIEDLMRQYGSFRAVNHLSFTVERGQIYGFLGPSGTRKSTTMNMITGYLSATEGTVLIDEHGVFLEPEEAKCYMGYLPEMPPACPDMNPQEYLTPTGELKGIPRRELMEEMERVIELTDTTHMRLRLIKNLSEGYRQRVGFTCALLGDPQVITLDEPTVGLGPKQIVEVRELIKSLGKEHTVTLSSHILSEVSAVCNHILIISKGKLVASNTPEGLEKPTQRTNVYGMLVQGDHERLGELLKGIHRLRTITTSAHDSGSAAVHLETDKKTDPRAQVFRLLAGVDCPIMELRSATMSLENVFLELTAQDMQTEGGAKHGGDL